MELAKVQGCVMHTPSTSSAPEQWQQRQLWKLSPMCLKIHRRECYEEYSLAVPGELLCFQEADCVLCAFGSITEKKKKAFLDPNFVFYCWKLFLNPKEYSFASVRQDLQCWKIKNLFWLLNWANTVWKLKTKHQ